MKTYFYKAFLALFFITFTFSVEAKNTKAQKQSIKFAPKSVTHIKDRHWHDANPTQKTSHFNKSMTVKKLHTLAVKTINEGTSKASSKNGPGRKIHEYSFKRSIGKTTNGQKAHTLRVVTSPKGEIITSFPVK